MKSSRRTRLMIWTALAVATGAVAVSAAQGGGPPADPGWIGLPHCAVPDVEGLQLAVARRTLRRERCGVYAPMRRRSTARRNSVLTEVPDAGTHLAPGTKILLIVSNGRRR